MLYDFLILEHYFGYAESAQNLEDVLKKYGPLKTKQALKKGLIKIHTSPLNSKNRHVFCCLTEMGRLAAKN